MGTIKDFFSFKLFLFSTIVIVLFYYLYRIENNIKNYNIYKTNINTLISLDLQFDSFLEKKDKFLNFDKIVLQTKIFENELDHIINSSIKTEFGYKLLDELKLIKKTYKKKRDFIERFKSRQASNLNSIHFIYDLNTYFKKNKNIDNKTQELISDTIFMIIQYFININDNKKYIFNNLDEIKTINTYLADKRMELLNTHSNAIINNIELIDSINNSSNNLMLNNKLKNIDFLLTKKYEDKLFQQLMIASIFFIFIIFIIIAIHKEHRKNKKIKKELMAFKYAVENSDNSIVITDKERNILYVNESIEKNTGYRKEELIGKNPNILSSGDNKRSLYKDLNDKLDAGEKWEGEFINKRKDGSVFYEKASIVPIIVNNKLQNYLAIKLDVTDYIKQNEKLELSSIAFDNVQEGIIICDKDKNIIAVNKALENILDYTKEDLIGLKPNLLKSGYHDKIFYKKMWNNINEHGFWKGKVYDKKKNGEIVPLWLNINLIKDKNGNTSHFIAVHTSLKEIIETQERADFLAFHDSLTSLPNRIKLEEDLIYSIKNAARNELNLFVLFIDLDRFKIINDTLGHGIGDELLKIVSKRIKNMLRDTDILARMGGDEFIVVLDSSRNKKSAGYVCEKILEIVKQTVVIEEHILNTSASIGVAMFPDDGTDMTTLIKHADSAMYYAKKLGKNNYQYYDKQLSVDVHDQLKIEQALKGVISRDELFLNYQPQYNLKTKKVVAFEALVRWIHPELGFISPDKFIKIAEDIGLIVEIGNFVFETACRDFVEFKKINKNLKYIAINISSIQFRDKNFLNDVLTVINKYGLESNEIELEVTERYIMEFSKNNMITIEKLRELGFRFSIDDFGTGYSSMSYLTKLPIDIIKVDKAFVDGTPDDNNNVQISKAIIALSKSLGYHVVAEGIENEKQEEFLLSLDCDIGQGYFFCKPLNFYDIVEFIKKK